MTVRAAHDSDAYGIISAIILRVWPLIRMDTKTAECASSRRRGGWDEGTLSVPAAFGTLASVVLVISVYGRRTGDAQEKPDTVTPYHVELF